MGVPSEREQPALATVVGVPFDCGTHETRVGARLAPDAIRHQSRLLRRYDVVPGPVAPSVTDYLRLTDAGNVNCPSGDVATAFPRIQSAFEAVHGRGAIPIGIGGDGAVTLPQLRAAAAHHENLVVLHLDAHTDSYDLEGLNSATTFTRAAEEGLVDVRRSAHVGVRGQASMPGAIEFARGLGYRVMPFDAIELAAADPLADVKAAIGDRPVYLCLDVDVFDPSCAPGVCIPEWGGLAAREGLALVRSLQGLNFVAFDINTVSPPHDPAGTTAFLAATLIHEFCHLAAHAVHSRPGRPAPNRSIEDRHRRHP
jgi:agmatinase